MELVYPLIDVQDVAPRHSAAAHQMRLAIGGAQDSATAAWHLTAKSGAPGLRHVHRRCDELVIHLSGTGFAAHGDELIATRPGLCRLIPKNTPHFFLANGSEADAISVGFLLGAPDLDSDFEGLGPVELTGIDAAAGDGTGLKTGLAVHLDDVTPASMDAGEGWSITDFRLPIAGHNGSSSTLFRARFFPGAIHKKHRHDHCDEIYYIISGHGMAGAGPDRVEVRAGQFHYIPRGVEHWLYNLSDDDPIEVVGIYIDADSVAATGYVYMGEVETADLG